MRINISYNTGYKNGKSYKVAHTVDFGFDVSVSFKKGTENLIQWDNTYQTYYVEYNPYLAGMKVQENGYLQLIIGG